MKKNSKKLIFIIFMVFLSSHAGVIAAAPSKVAIIFGVPPQQSPSELAHLWNPFFTYLSEKTGHPFQFRTARDLYTYEHRLDKGEFDISYMNPYHYTVVHKTVGYEAFAKEKERRLKGIIVTRKDSPYKTIEDLQGLQIAFPGPVAIAATILPLAHLKKAGVTAKPVYVSSHDSVFRTVAKGLYPAGGTIERLFESLDPELRNQLHILWHSKAYTPHAIAAHPRVSKALIEQVKNVMLTMDQDPRGRELLHNLTFTGFSAATDAEYADMRALSDMVKEVTTHTAK